MEGDRSKVRPKTRAQQMEAAAGGEFEPDMPDPGPAAYLIRHLWAAGPTLGDQVLTNSELRDYQANAGIQLSPWECETLRRLSGEYLGQTQKAREQDSPPPFAESSDAKRLQKARVKAKLRKFLD